MQGKVWKEKSPRQNLEYHLKSGRRRPWGEGNKEEVETGGRELKRISIMKTKGKRVSRSREVI